MYLLYIIVTGYIFVFSIVCLYLCQVRYHKKMDRSTGLVLAHLYLEDRVGHFLETLHQDELNKNKVNRATKAQLFRSSNHRKWRPYQI